eukprot:1184179-Prorocentrum_minimum.AAC.4
MHQPLWRFEKCEPPIVATQISACLTAMYGVPTMRVPRACVCGGWSVSATVCSREGLRRFVGCQAAQTLELCQMRPRLVDIHSSIVTSRPTLSLVSRRSRRARIRPVGPIKRMKRGYIPTMDQSRWTDWGAAPAALAPPVRVYCGSLRLRFLSPRDPTLTRAGMDDGG